MNLIKKNNLLRLISIIVFVINHSSICVHNFVNFNVVNIFFFNWDSLHARLNSHYKAWSYKKKKHKKIKAYRKFLYKEPTVNRCLLILELSHLDYRSEESIP